ncbi:hypothetical protein D3C80_1350470 [compost metagenome]
MLVTCVAVNIRVVFRRAELLPEVSLLGQQGKQNIPGKIQIALFYKLREFLIAQAAIINTKNRFQFIEPHVAVNRNLLIAVTLPVLIDRQKTPACPRVPVFKRIIIVIFHVHPAVAVRVNGYLQRIMHAVRHPRIVFKIGSVPQEKSNISKLRLCQMPCIHGGNLQIYIGIKCIDPAPAGVPFPRPHSIQTRCACTAAADHGISALVIHLLHKSMIDSLRS